MTVRRPTTMRKHFILVLCSVGLAGVLLLGAAPAQQPAGVPLPTPAPRPAELGTIPLKHASVERVQPLLRGLLDAQMSKRVRIIAAADSNALLVAATPVDFEVVKRYVQKLDVEPSLVRPFQIISLRRLPDPSFERDLNVVRPPGIQLSVDHELGVVIVSGTERDINVVRLFVNDYEEVRTHRAAQMAEKPVAREIRLRLVWLASSPADTDAIAPPQDLKKVVEELAALDIKDLRLVSQTIITTAVGDEFQAEGLSQFGGKGLRPCRLKVTGSSSSRGNQIWLPLTVAATRTGHENAKDAKLCEIHTQIVAPPGRSVVLGVTPTEGATSVFVVQVLSGGHGGPAEK